jgi:hypothetical protein
MGEGNSARLIRRNRISCGKGGRPTFPDGLSNFSMTQVRWREGCHVDIPPRLKTHPVYRFNPHDRAHVGVNTRTQRRFRTEAPLLFGGCFLFTPFPPLFTRGFSRRPRSSRGHPTDGLPPFFLLRNRAPPRARHSAGPSQTVPSPLPVLASLSRVGQ